MNKVDLCHVLSELRASVFWPHSFGSSAISFNFEHCISGYKDLAEAYLSKFKWGKGFLKLNQELLDTYANCKTSKDVVDVQATYLEAAQREHDSRGA